MRAESFNHVSRGVLESQRAARSSDADELTHITKTLENGEKAELILSNAALEELGGYDNVKQVFDQTINDENTIFLITSNELSDVTAGKSLSASQQINQQVAFLDQQFGENIDYGFRGIDEFWRDKTIPANRNYYDSENPSVITMNSSYFENGVPNIDADRQQRINFWLAHELDHSDHQGYDNMVSELTSDIVGLKALNLDETQTQRITDSLIHLRIRDEISRVASGTLVNKGFIGRDDYSFAPYIKDALKGDWSLPPTADKDAVTYQTAIAEAAENILPERLKAAYTYPTSPTELLLSSDRSAAAYTKNELYRSLRRMDIPDEHKKSLLNEAQNLPELHKQARAEFLKELHEQFPQSFEQEVDRRFFSRIYNNANSLLDNMPDVIAAAYKEEMSQIDSIENDDEQNLAKIEFAKRLVHENNDAYQEHMHRTETSYAVAAVIQHQPDVWENALKDIAQTVNKEPNTLNADFSDALKTYIEYDRQENTAQPSQDLKM